MSRSPKARPKIFLCHAKRDAVKAESLFHLLTTAGANPWLDKMELVLGDEWEQEIKAAVALADAFVVCLRPGFDEIGFRQKEVRWAIEAFHLRPPGVGFIVPFIVEPCELPRWCEHLHAGTVLTKPTETTDLIRALSKHTGVALAVPATPGHKPARPTSLPKTLPELLELQNHRQQIIYAHESDILETGGDRSDEFPALDAERQERFAIDRRIQALRDSAEDNAKEVHRLQQAMLASYPGDRERAARHLGQMGDVAATAVPSLRRALRDPSLYVRNAAAWALGEIDTEEARVASIEFFHRNPI